MSHLLARLRSALTPTTPPTPDVELLSRFLDRNDQDAFAELVRRYGPVVLGVCRRTLGNSPDADDAYQAAFLVLAKRAATVRGIGRVAGWLHGVATLCAKKARTRRARLQRREQTGPLPDVPARPEANSELAGVLDDELAAIPEKYRTAVVLCELRQLTLDQAAVELGVPRGTVASRLARGREALGKRLLRRELLSFVPPVLSVEPPPAEPTPAAHSLSREVLRTMTFSNFRWLPLAVLPLVAVAVGLLAADPPRPTPPPPKAEEADKTKSNATVERVRLVAVGGLLEQEAVRKDIGLTKEQTDGINAAREVLQKKMRATDAALKRGGHKGDGEFAGLRRQVDGYTNVVIEHDTAIRKHLTGEQVYRLKQILIQCEGPTALLGRYAVRELALTAEQEDRIADALQKLTMPKVVDLSVSIAADPDNPLLAKFLAARAAELDALREAAVNQLTAEQKARWKEMTGELLPTVCLLEGSPQGFVLREAYKMEK